uniref:Intraflagellar transport protein 122 homolog n=1 Tax=Schistosoma haematobium TaxID=6185 RepID=A0A095BX64_SCHHA
MDTAQVWSFKVKGKDGVANWYNCSRNITQFSCSIWDLCYSPDGSQLIVASGNLVWVYRADNGSLIKNLKGHKDTVYCVAYAHDSSIFASGSSDKYVIIWKSSTLEGLLKYVHNESIQCLEFNPVTVLLASTGSTDFGFWTMDQKSVVKTKILARPTCCSWKSDGQLLAIGLYNGVISIRNKETEEVVKIERTDNHNLIVHFKNDHGEILAVVDWNQKLSFYQLCGRQTGKDYILGYDPCNITWFGNKYESLAICGSNKMCQLYNNEGVRLACINKQQSWIWCCCTRNGYNQIIQLSEKILIYESSSDDMKDMHYRICAKLLQQIHCHYLLIITNHLIICQNNCLSCINFKGIKEREWIVDSPVNCIRVIGGLPNKEGLLLGLKDGQVVQIILDNTFPIYLTKVMNEVYSVDISRNRDKLAIVDSNKTMSVYSLEKQESLFQEPNVFSISWSTTNNELLAYTGNDLLFIKNGQFPSHRQYNKGQILNFTGSIIYCLHENIINHIEISLSPAVYHYLGTGQLNEAYQLACFGLTDQDWKVIGRMALNKLNLKVAKCAYIQLEDILMLTFIQQLEERSKRGEWNNKELINNSSNISMILGDISAYLGNFNEAVMYYTKANSNSNKINHKIIDMYTDLRRFNEAHEMIKSNNNDDINEHKLLLSKNADWAKSTNEHRTAAKMYIDADISRRLDKSDHEYLERCARSLTRLGEYAFAADCYAKYGDIENQLNLYIESYNWEEAFSLVEKHHDYTRKVYLPYANWLAENDKFEEAQTAFIKAGLQNEAISVLEQLATCAAKESRFDDAGFYYWKLSVLCLNMLNNETITKTGYQELLDRYDSFQRKADVYYVYNNIHHFLHEPFASHMSETYFNMARYLIHILQFGDIPEVSKAAVLYTLAKHGRALGAYKLTKQIYDRLQTLHLPSKMRDEVDLSSITLNSGPMIDSEEISTMCYRCSATNPLLNSLGNRCINCKEPFLYSFINLEQLPIVEFIPEDNLSYEEVKNYLQKEPSSYRNSKDEDINNVELNNDFSQTLKISHKQENGLLDQDPFMAKLLNSDLISESYSPVQLDIATLKAMSFNEVIIVNNPPLKPRYYKSVLPDVSITQCTATKQNLLPIITCMITPQLKDTFMLGINEVTLGNEENKLGFCHHKHTMLSDSEISSCINEHINYGLSLAKSPEYEEIIIKNMCKHHAADKHKLGNICLHTH